MERSYRLPTVGTEPDNQTPTVIPSANSQVKIWASITALNRENMDNLFSLHEKEHMHVLLWTLDVAPAKTLAWEAKYINAVVASGTRPAGQ